MSPLLNPMVLSGSWFPYQRSLCNLSNVFFSVILFLTIPWGKSALPLQLSQQYTWQNQRRVYILIITLCCLLYARICLFSDSWIVLFFTWLLVNFSVKWNLVPLSPPNVPITEMVVRVFLSGLIGFLYLCNYHFLKKLLDLFAHICICVHSHMRMPQHEWWGQRTACGGQFSNSTILVIVSHLSFSGLAARDFTQWVISLARVTVFLSHIELLVYASFHFNDR